VRGIDKGHAAGLLAMQLAAREIAAGDADVAIVAGVDSYHDPDTLEWLDRSGLLMSASNRNGYPPGEGAGACLLASRAFADRSGLPVLGQVVAAGSAMEPHPIRSGRVCVGDGLSSALRGMIGRLEAPRPILTAAYCDLNGERYRSEELTYTLLRVQQSFAKPHDYLSPADCWGDVGAASGPLFAALAAVAARRGYLSGAHPALWAGSESGYRAAVAMDMAAGRRGVRA
jgi:3-oxoacyl-[acyl-carrier-protein] synthase-1